MCLRKFIVHINGSKDIQEKDGQTKKVLEQSGLLSSEKYLLITWQRVCCRDSPQFTVISSRKTDFALIILFLLCLLLLVVRQHTLYVTLQIYKHYIQILVFTIHLSCLLLSVIGMNFQSKIGTLQALTSSKTVWNSIWSHHPDTITQVKDLVKYIMLD